MKVRNGVYVFRYWELCCLFISFLFISCPVIWGGPSWGSPALSSLKGLQTSHTVSSTSTSKIHLLKAKESSRGNVFISAVDKYSRGPRRRLRYYHSSRKNRNTKQVSAHKSKIQEESKTLPLPARILFQMFGEDFKDNEELNDINIRDEKRFMINK